MKNGSLATDVVFYNAKIWVARVQKMPKNSRRACLQCKRLSGINERLSPDGP